MLDMRYDFDIMCKDEKIAEIRFIGYDVCIKKCTDNFLQIFNGKNENLNTVYHFLESRCYEGERADLSYILEQAGLSSNNPWEWCKVTHGVTWEDYYWIRLPKEKIQWKDVKIRD